MWERRRLFKILAFTIILLGGGLMLYSSTITKRMGERKGAEKNILESCNRIEQKRIEEREGNMHTLFSTRKVNLEICLNEANAHKKTIGEIKVKNYAFLKLTNKSREYTKTTRVDFREIIDKEKTIKDILTSCKSFIFKEIKSAINEVIGITKNLAAWIPVTIVAFVSSKIAKYGKEQKTLSEKDADLMRGRLKDLPKDKKPSLRIMIGLMMKGGTDYLEGERRIIKIEEDWVEEGYDTKIQQSLVLTEDKRKRGLIQKEVVPQRVGQLQNQRLETQSELQTTRAKNEQRDTGRGGSEREGYYLKKDYSQLRERRSVGTLTNFGGQEEVSLQGNPLRKKIPFPDVKGIEAKIKQKTTPIGSKAPKDIREVIKNMGRKQASQYKPKGLEKTGRETEKILQRDENKSQLRGEQKGKVYLFRNYSGPNNEARLYSEFTKKDVDNKKLE